VRNEVVDSTLPVSSSSSSISCVTLLFLIKKKQMYWFYWKYLYLGKGVFLVLLAIVIKHSDEY
jgi:hypothetical protein